MNFGQYEAFVKAVEAGTMTQAAERTGVQSVRAYAGTEFPGRGMGCAPSHERA